MAGWDGRWQARRLPHKENEIPAARRLPARAELSGRLIRLEALGTQHASAARVVLGNGPDYHFTLKTKLSNHPGGDVSLGF